MYVVNSSEHIYRRILAYALRFKKITPFCLWIGYHWLKTEPPLPTLPGCLILLLLIHLMWYSFLSPLVKMPPADMLFFYLSLNWRCVCCEWRIFRILNRRMQDMVKVFESYDGFVALRVRGRNWSRHPCYILTGDSKLTHLCGSNAPCLPQIRWLGDQI